MFRTYFKTTFRNLAKNRTYSFLNVVGLAIGVACAGIIFLWAEDEFNYNSAFSKRERLYQVRTNQSYGSDIRTFDATPAPLATVLVRDIPGVAAACRTAWDNPLFSVGDKSLYETGLYADPAFLNMFMLQFLQGQAAGAFTTLNSIVISEKMSRQLFGDDPNVIGKTLSVNNKEEYRITGVYKDLPANTSLPFEWVSPFEIYARGKDWLQSWDIDDMLTYVELAPGADASRVSQQFYNYLQRKDKDATTRLLLFGMKDWRLRDNFVNGKQTGGGRIEFVRLFIVIAWIILVIACINFMNLATARSAKRAKEVGVRKVLGAPRGKLVGQFIGEAMALSFLSVVLGLLVISLVLPLFNTLAEKQLVLGLGNPLHIGAAVVIVLFCGLVAGSYPSFYLSSFNPIYVFKGLRAKSGGATIIRRGLVVFQFTISIVLIISTVFVYQQVKYILNRDLGYDKARLLDIPLTGSMLKDFGAIRQDLLNTGVVENAALSSHQTIYTQGNTAGYSWEGKDPNSSILVSVRSISPEYFSTMGMRLMEGRRFRTGSQSDTSNIVITESMASLMGHGSAIGKMIHDGDRSYKVVGVIKDYVYGDFYGKPDPVVFFSQPAQTNYLYIRYKDKAGTQEALTKIAAVLKKDNPGYPFDYSWVADEIGKRFKSETLIGNLSRIFAALAIIISCLGLFGLSAYTAELRTKEIGIRKVLGARVAGIAGLLSADFLKLVVLSNLVAIPLAWWVSENWLRNYAYRISINPWVFVLAGTSALLIALLTISFQAINAALSNPIRTLRSE
jgi:putative ABC transport system permease protein